MIVTRRTIMCRYPTSAFLASLLLVTSLHAQATPEPTAPPEPAGMVHAV